MPSSSLPIAAVVYNPGTAIEALLASASRVLVERGVKVGGVVQHDLAGAENRICQMELEDLATGQRIALSQDLGAGSVSCAVDASSLAEAAVMIRQALEAGADLVMINKFGTQEVAGGGLRAEMGLVVAAGVPLLTAVGERYLDAWAEFTGGEAALLPATLPAILDWWACLAGENSAEA